MGTKLKPLRYVAICPDCDARKELAYVPAANTWWPQCEECCQSMNVYERNQSRRA